MYKARENDELALEKADIIMVMQYSNDGEQNERYLKLWLAIYLSSIKLLTAQSSFRRSFSFVVVHLKEWRDFFIFIKEFYMEAERGFRDLLEWGLREE